MKKLLNALVWYVINMAVGLFPVIIFLFIRIFGFDQDVNATANGELTSLLEEFIFSFVGCGIACAVSFDAYSIKLKFRRPYDLLAVLLLICFLGGTVIPFMITIFAHARMGAQILVITQLIMTILTAVYSITIKSLMP